MANSTLVDLAPRGDVALICSDSNEPRNSFRLRTSSHVLRVGSSVFTAMLSPQFREGQVLAEHGSVEITLPEDDATAMITMCKVMHMSRENESPGAAELAVLAMHVDKYDTSRAVGLAMYVWISELVSQSTKPYALRTGSGAGLLLGAAYTLGDAQLFSKIGTDIALYSSKHPQFQSVKNGPEALPQILARIQDLRDRTVQSIGAYIESIVSDEMDDQCGCVFQRNRVFQMLWQLKVVGLWPISALEEESIDEVTQMAKNFRLSSLDDLGLCSNRQNGFGTRCEGGSGHGLEDITAYLHEQAENWEFDLHVCFQCAQDKDAEFGPECSHH